MYLIYKSLHGSALTSKKPFNSNPYSHIKQLMDLLRVSKVEEDFRETTQIAYRNTTC